MEISSVYYSENTSVETFEIKVAMWPNGIDDAHATWGAGQNTGRTVGGRNAIGYLVDIRFLPPNKFIQGLLFRHLKLVRSFEKENLGGESNTIARFWFNSSPDYNGVRRIHRDVIIKFTKLLKSKGYLVHFDSAFLTDDDFFRETATTPSDIKELEEIKKEKEREEAERERQLAAEAAERESEKRKRIAELMTLDEAAQREYQSRERAAIAREREAEAAERKAEAAQREAEAQRQAADSVEREAVARERVVEAARREKPTMPKGWSPEEDKPKKISKPKKESSDPIGTSRLNREQLREAGRKRIKEREKIIKSTYEKKRRRRQSSGGGKKAIIIGIPVLVVFVVLFSGMNQGDVIEVPPTTVQDLKCNPNELFYENDKFKIQLSGAGKYGQDPSCWFYDSNIANARITGINAYGTLAVIIQDKNDDSFKCIKKIPSGVFTEYIPIHKYAKYGINTIYLAMTTDANAPNSGYYEGIHHKCWIKDNKSFGTIKFGLG